MELFNLEKKTDMAHIDHLIINFIVIIISHRVFYQSYLLEAPLFLPWL